MLLWWRGLKVRSICNRNAVFVKIGRTILDRIRALNDFGEAIVFGGWLARVITKGIKRWTQAMFTVGMRGVAACKVKIVQYLRQV